MVSLLKVIKVDDHLVKFESGENLLAALVL